MLCEGSVGCWAVISASAITTSSAGINGCGLLYRIQILTDTFHTHCVLDTVAKYWEDK